MRNMFGLGWWDGDQRLCKCWGGLEKQWFLSVVPFARATWNFFWAIRLLAGGKCLPGVLGGVPITTDFAGSPLWAESKSTGEDREKSDNFFKAVGFGCFDRNNKVRACLVRFVKRTGVLDGLVERLGKRAAAGVRRPFECFLRF